MNAKAPVLTTTTLRIARVRARIAKLCVVFDRGVDLDTNHNDRSSTLVVSIPADICVPQSPQVG
jgi:hypothetical protein